MGPSIKIVLGKVKYVFWHLIRGDLLQTPLFEMTKVDGRIATKQNDIYPSEHSQTQRRPITNTLV